MEKNKTYWHEYRILNNLQDAFGKMIVRQSNLPDKEVNASGSDAEALYLLAGATLAAVQDSHSCLDLQKWIQEWKEKYAEETAPQTTKKTLPDDLVPRLEAWMKKCSKLNTDILTILNDNGGVFTPNQLVILRTDEPLRAYLNRYYLYEKNIGSRIKNMQGTSAIQNELKEQVSKTNFRPKDDSQKEAIEHALEHDFAIITGGPGRGKTTVLTELLAFHIKAFLETKGRSMRVAICAPTGKASVRMKESIDNAISAMSEEGKAFFPEEVVNQLKSLTPLTLHKLLGIYENSDYPSKNASNPLDFDLVAVDECSMMSLKLFNELLMALKPDTKLVLLGDENQLQSVEEGNVLAKLCECQQEQGIVNRLLVNHRSDANPALCEYTNALVGLSKNAPDVTTLYSEHTPPTTQGLFQAFELPETKKLEEELKKILKTFGILDEKGKPMEQHYENAQDALKSIASFKILAAVREGHYGVKGLNIMMRRILEKEKTYADGVPIIITQNDAVTGLSNGDIGVCFKNKVHFPGIDENGTPAPKEFDPVQLPSHECAFAMTIHKSQGSDYPNVLMVLPDKDMPLLTKELIYTGITRTKTNFILLAKRDILEKAQQRKTIRWSGLDKWLKS